MAFRLTAMVSCEVPGSGAKGAWAIGFGPLFSKSRRAREAAAIAGDTNGSAAGGCGVGADLIVLRPAGIPNGGGVAGGLAGG